MTTSFLCSTRRLAFSITISATCTCRWAGSSNVDEITSPCTERCMSVTSSGRSSMSRTMRYTSGWFLVMLFAMFCSSIVLPVRGGDETALALADRHHHVQNAGRQVLGLGLEGQLLLRVQRRQVFEEDLLA